jgi:hypothetical protein
MTFTTYLIIFAVLILLTLSAIAAYYLAKLKKVKNNEEEQAKKNQEAWLSHKNELVKDIKFIANSILQEQCEITEGCMRLGYLMPKVDESEEIQTRFGSLFDHYRATSNMPIKEAYKALTRKEQFKFDSKRLRLEAENKSGVLSDCKILLKHSF